MRYDKNRATRFDRMDDEMVTKRWMAMRPTALRGLVVCAVVAVGSYVTHKIMYPQVIAEQKVQLMSKEYFLTLGFQIGCIFAVCFLMLTVMAFAYGRETKREG